MELKNRTLSNFAELVRTGECKNFKGRLKVGVDLGTANTVLAVVDNTNRPIAGISAPSRAIRDGVIVNFYESVQLVTKLKAELEEKLKTELPYAAAAIPPGVSQGSIKSIQYVLPLNFHKAPHTVCSPGLWHREPWAEFRKPHGFPHSDRFHRTSSPPPIPEALSSQKQPSQQQPPAYQIRLLLSSYLQEPDLL